MKRSAIFEFRIVRRTGSGFTLGVAMCLLCVSCDNGPEPTAPNLSAPQCSLSTAALDFGTVQVGQTAQRTFKITNTGGGTLTGTVSESCPDYSVAGVSTFNLGAGLAQTFTLRFTPGSEGLKACTVDVGTACAPISMSGTGQAPTCEVSPATLDFGTIAPGESDTLQFTIRNIGSGVLTGTVSEACADFRLIGPVSYSLDAGQSATFTVEFVPTTDGALTCDIATGSAACSSILATGVSASACLVSTTSIDFGTVPPSAPDPERTFTISNPGGGRLTGVLTFDGLDCGSLVDGPNFEIIGLNSYDIGPGEAETFIVRFSPNQFGTFTCRLQTGNAECPDIELRGVKL
jgi:hypothetical protein